MMKPHIQNGEALVKVMFDLANDPSHEHGTETLWAEPVGRSQYALRNVPFLAYGYSFADVVHARERDGMLVVDRVARASGHSTYRVFVKDEARFLDRWPHLEGLGCSFERATDKLYAVDVSPEASLEEVLGLLEAGEADGAWEYEEGHRGHR